MRVVRVGFQSGDLVRRPLMKMRSGVEGVGVAGRKRAQERDSGDSGERGTLWCVRWGCMAKQSIMGVCFGIMVGGVQL